MRYVSMAAVAIFVSTLVPTAFGQIDSTKLTISGYQLLSEVRVTRTQSYFTYRADLSNSGPAIPAITATVTSLVPANASVVSGKGNLHFPPAPANSTVTSLNTFTILVDRTAVFGFNLLQWSFVAPVANAGPDQTAAVGSTVTLNGSGSTNPSGIGTLAYSWQLVSTPQGSQATLTNPTSVTPTFVPDLMGIYVVTLTVGNGAGTDTSSVNVNVNTTAPPPVADAGPNQTVNVGATVHLDGSKSHDFNGNPLTYSWTFIQRPPGSAAVLTGANTVSPTFIADVATTGTTTSYVIQLVVNDGTSSSPPALVTIATSPVNTPPVANAGSAQSVAVGATVQLDGSKSTDVDGDPLTYKWSLLTVPAGSAAILSNPAIVNPTFTADIAGTYIAQLIVNDGKADSTPSTVMITTTAPSKPIANAGPDQTVQIGGTPVALSGTGTDPQGLPLTFHWTLTKPSGSAAVLSNPGIPNPTFVPDVLGQYVVQLIVNNGALNSDPSTVTITAKDTQPVANAGPPQTIAAGSTVTLDGSGSSDSDQAPLKYKWSLLTIPAGSSTVLLSPTTVSPTFVADVAGTYVAQLIVNDGFQDSVPSTVMITAAAPNFITLSPDPLNLVNNPGTLTITLGAPAVSDVTVTLTVLDPTVATAPANVTVLAGSATATATITPVNAGSTNILASAPGEKPGSATINVGQPAITLTLSANSVGVGNTVNGTITLNSPAPGNGVNIALSLDKTGSVSLSSTSVNIAGGSSTGTFTVTGGPNTGQATITAASTGYTSGSAIITSVTQGSIALQQGVTVAPGQSLPITITLDHPAVSAVTVTLTSGDPTKVTVTSSVTINAGATTPSTPAQVTGVNFGSATVTASAPGYISDSQSVAVAANLSFSPQTVTLGAGNTTNLTLTLSGSAPANGVLVSLASDNTNAATVPVNVTIPQGQSTATVTVTGVGQGTAHITASSNVSGIVNGTATINVVTVPVITTQSLASGIVNSPYSATVAATGGTSPYTWSATGLPAGLAINASTGVISGTATSVGTSTATVTVKDSSSPQQTGTASLSITITSPLTITTTSPLTSGVVNVAYSATVGATGGTSPYTWSATGLPAGLAINASTGVISGTATSVGTSTATVTVKDSSSPQQTGTASLSITITSPLTITTTSPLTSGVVNVAYSATVAASNGTTPYTWSATGLPAGLAINTSTGVISGTPTSAGTSTATITVKDASSPQQTATASLSITITPALTITTTSPLTSGVVNVAYSATVAASNGTTPYTWSAAGLPAGLAINTSTGVISGTPTSAGTSTATITVKDASSPQQTATASLSITITPALTITTTSPLTSGVVNVAYSATVAASNGTTPYTWSAAGLPAGLAINTSTGVISGTPTSAGTSTATITVKDASTPQQTATASLSITVNPPALTITTSMLLSGTENVSYSATVTATGGTNPYTWSATGLPTGLSINPGNGAVSGTPAAGTQGTYTVNVTVKDSSSPQMSTTAGVSLTINPAVTTGSTVAITGGTVGQNLQIPITITLSPASGGGTVQISSNNPSIVQLGAHAGDVGSGSLSIQVSAGQTTFSIFAQGVASAGSVTLTAQAAGYNSGTSTVSAAPSAFVLAGPNGIGGSFTSGQNAASTLTISAAQLDSSGNVAQIQPVAGGQTVVVALTVADPNAGTVVPASVTFAGGTSAVNTQFTAGSSTVSSVITANEPSNFSTPAGNANVLAVTVQNINLSCQPVTVGFNLENFTSCSLSGVTDSDLTVMLSSNDTSKLLLSTDPTVAGSATITRTIRAGGSSTAPFYVYGQGNSGTATFTASAGGFNATGTVTLAPSGFIVFGPFGLGGDLSATAGGAPQDLTVQTALLDSSGNYLDTQNLAGGVTASVAVTSSNTGVGTISGSPAIITGATNSATVQFNPLSSGTTVITAVTPPGAGYTTPAQYSTLNANVTNPRILIDSGNTIGKNLERMGTIILLGAAAPSNGLPVTLTVTAGSLSLSSTGTNAGSSSIVVTIPAGQSSGTYFMYGLDIAGQATVSATAPGYNSGSGTETLTPSAIVIAGPQGVGVSPFNTPLASGNQPLSISTAQIDSSGNFIETQALAGTTALTVTLTNSNPAAGTVPASVSITPGNDTGTVQFHPVAVGTTTIGVNQPAGGYSAPTDGTNSLKINVQ